MRSPVLSVSNLEYRYPHTSQPVLEDLNLNCFAGRLYGLCGFNGCGKTTLLNILSGFLSPGKGVVAYYGEVPPSRSPHRLAVFRGGLMRTFQDPILVDFLTVEENLRLASRSSHAGFSSLFDFRRPYGEDKEFEARLNVYISRFGLDTLRHTQAQLLSYGMRRLVATLLGLLTTAGMILLDEPFSNLDTAHRQILKQVLREEVQHRGRCALIVEHSNILHQKGFVDATYYLRRTLTFVDGDGASAPALLPQEL